MSRSDRATIRSDSVPAVTSAERPRLSDLRSHLTCELCSGYLVDATSITECLHTFCRSCILNHLEKKSDCPVCHIAVLKSKASCSLRLDRTLQMIVYKMVPSLFHSEMARRRSFYEERPYADPELASWAKGDVGSFVPHIYLPKELVSIKLQMCQSGGRETPARYIRCQAGTPLSALHKLVRCKLQLSTTSTIDVEFLHKNTVLSLDLTLMDVGYMHSVSQNETFELFYRLVPIEKQPSGNDFITGNKPAQNRLSSGSESSTEDIPSLKRPLPVAELVNEYKPALKRTSGNDSVTEGEPPPKRSFRGSNPITESEPPQKHFEDDEASSNEPSTVSSTSRVLDEVADRSQSKSLMFDADDDEPTSPKVVQDIIDSLEDAADDGINSKVATMSSQTTGTCDNYNGSKNSVSNVQAEEMVVDVLKDKFHQDNEHELFDKPMSPVNVFIVKEEILASTSETPDVKNGSAMTDCVTLNGKSPLKAQVKTGNDDQEMVLDDTGIGAESANKKTASLENAADKYQVSNEEGEIQVESTSIDTKASGNQEEGDRSLSESSGKETYDTAAAPGWCEDDSDSDSDPSALIVDESDLSNSVNSSDGAGDRKAPTDLQCAHHSNEKPVELEPKDQLQSLPIEGLEVNNKQVIANDADPNDICGNSSQSKDESEECLVADSPKLPGEGSKSDEVQIVRKFNISTDVASLSECVSSVAQTVAPSKVDCSVQTSTNDELKNFRAQTIEQKREVDPKCSTMTDATTTTDLPCMKPCVPESSTANGSQSPETKANRSTVATNTDETAKNNKGINGGCFTTPSGPVVRSVNDVSTPILSQSRSLSFGVRNLINDFSKSSPIASVSATNGCVQSERKVGPNNNDSAVKKKNSACILEIPEAHSSGACRASQKNKNSKYRPLDLSKRVSKTVKSVVPTNKPTTKDGQGSLQKSNSVSEGTSGSSNRISSIVNNLASRQNITLTPISKSDNSKSLPFQKISTPAISVPPVSSVPSASTTAAASSPGHVDLASAYSRLLCPPHALPADVVARVEYDLAMRNLLTLSHMALSRGQSLPFYMNPGGASSVPFSPHASPSYLQNSVQPSNIPLPHSSSSHALSESLHSTAAAQWLQQKHLHHLQQHALGHPHQLPQLFQQSSSTSAQPSSSSSAVKKSSPLVGCTAPKVRSPPETSSASLRRLEAVGCDKDVANSVLATAHYSRKRAPINSRCIEK